MDFLLRKPTISSAQKFLDKLEHKVDLHVPADHPLPSVKELRKLAVIVAQIKGFESELEKLSDDELRAKSQSFKERYTSDIKEAKDTYEKVREEYNSTLDVATKENLSIELDRVEEDYHKKKKQVLDDMLPEAFAVVREAGKRTLGMRHYDVQMVGGITLHNGNIAEMTTGEGKTLMATLPVYLNALTGDGVHVVTVNDYLASRDADWMAPLYEFLGLTVGKIQHDMTPSERQQNYACDITYGTNNEFGFDYLRDNMVNYKEDMVQRYHHFAVVDEVDSILIDEARTPLIISGPAEESTDKYYKANEIAKKMKGRRITEQDQIDAKHKEIDLSEGYDYLADEKAKSISLTDAGEEKAAQLFGVENLHDMDTIEYRHHILQSLKAKEFFVKDVDYVVQDGGVVIVDEFTGRLMPGRRWSDGLHQAVEASEGIKIERENQTLATITFQNYFRMYEKLSGMTGTAMTEATEFSQIYELECVVIPTNKVLQRLNHNDSIYKTIKEKFNAVVEDIAECHERGQPVLVGTISIEKSEVLSNLLKAKGVPHKVLNAKHHENESHIIAQAGRYKAVTIATNMAGRGTDIVLGGNAEYLAKQLVSEKASDKDSDEEKEALTQKFIEQFKQQCKEEHDKVIELGGLYVIGTERHESRRIDNQLRGRQGRQGDPGASRFYVALEDDLMRLFASDKIMSLYDKLGMEEGMALENPLLSRALETAQRRVEGHNFEIRKHLLEFDNVMNKQREVIYDMRRNVLESEDIKHEVTDAIQETIRSAVHTYLFTGSETDAMAWDIEGLDVYLKAKFNFELGELKDKLKDMNQDEINDLLVKEFMDAYDRKEQEIGVEQHRHMERMLMMHTIDTKWKEHLYAMDQLKEGISLRSYGQRDPIIEYKKEGFAMFEAMYNSIGQEVAEIVYKIQPASERQEMKSVFGSVPQKLVHDEASGINQARAQAQAQAAMQQTPQQPQQQKAAPVQNAGPKVGRNDPCPCGSGKKYKKCCGK